MRTRKNTVPEQLTKLGDIFRQRNIAYGDSIRIAGHVLAALFPISPVIETPGDWNRMCAFLHVVDKVIRYANNFNKCGHADSLDDISVYSQILQMLDNEMREMNAKELNDDGIDIRHGNNWTG